MKVYNILFLIGVLFVGQIFAGQVLAEGQEPEKVHSFLSEERVQFRYEGRDSYHCDFIKAETSAILRRLGARDVRVHCLGGAPYERFSFVDAEFISIRQTTSIKATRLAMMTPVSLKFSKSCELHSVIVREVLLGFDVIDYVDSGSCASSRGQVTFDMKTLF